MFLAIYTYGQRPYSDSERIEDNRIEAGVISLDFDTLKGRVPILYSQGYIVRATAIQSMMEHCALFYEKKFPDIRFDFEVFLLNHNDWRQSNIGEYSPYGMPDAEPLINKIFMGTDKKAVGELFGETDNLPDSMLSDFDCIGLHELGHIFLERYNHTYLYKMWVDEFLASYFAICFFERYKNYPQLPQVGEYSYTPKYKTLADFERLYTNVGARNYGWYQGQFQNLGYALYPTFKTRLLRIFIANNGSTGHRLPALVLLKKLAPNIMERWLKEMQ
jgi:hypothetical protein